MCTSDTGQGSANQRLSPYLVSYLLLLIKFYWKHPVTITSFPRETLEVNAPAPPPWQTQAHRIQRPEATHQLVPFLRQQGIAVLEFPDDRAQLRNLKLETPSILFIQLLFLKQKSTANNCS